MDPATGTALVKAATELEPAVQEFAAEVTGAARTELGAWMADHVRYRRWRTQLRILGKAAAQARAAGFAPGRVPLKTLAPLLDGGSLEEDEEMVDRWAALLANAAGAKHRVPPSFPSVLRELEPTAARILDFIWDGHLRIAPELRRRFGITIEDHERRMFGVSDEEFAFHLDNPIRLRLIDSPDDYLDPASTEPPGFRLTAFGAAFVHACHRPDQPDPPIQFADPGGLEKLASEGGSIEDQPQ
jgi:hypothetical protein